MGIFQLLGRLGETWAKELDPILVHQAACTHALHRASTCSRCIKICPVDAISRRNGKIEIAPSCLDCGLCVSVCPLEALERRKEGLADFYARLSHSIQGGEVKDKPRGTGQSIQGREVKDKPRGTDLSIQRGEVKDKPQGTGPSIQRGEVKDKPQGTDPSIQGREVGNLPPSSSFDQSVPGGGRLLIKCGKVPESPNLDKRLTLFPVGCLGEIEEAALQIAMTEGVREFYFVGGECKRCPYYRGGEAFHERLNDWKRRFRSVSFHHVEMGRSKETPSNETDAGRGRPDLEAEGREAPHKMDRRTFFKEMTERTKTLTMKSFAEEKESAPWQGGELQKPRLIRLQIRQRWAEEDGAFHEGAEPGSLLITDQCIDCGICAKGCPADAIEIDREKGLRRIDPARCVHCALCQEVCFRKAIISVGN